MRLDAIFYRLAYRSGRPRWDTGTPRPELRDLAGTGGRALDLGCGTGTDAMYLAQHGWQVVGVDFVPEAIATANTRAHSAGSEATFMLGDVTRLRAIGVRGPFDLVIDIGCFHGISADRRDAYAAEVAAVTRQGADFYLAGVAHPPTTWRLLGARGMTEQEVRRRFGDHFDLRDETAAGGTGRAAEFVRFHLVRR
jgi:cyclopropane fatty-acyl-phospholipid synthase-like methyltransferase